MAAAAAAGIVRNCTSASERHSHAAAAVVKNEGKPNDLLERLQADPAFSAVDFSAELNPRRFMAARPSKSTNSSRSTRSRFVADISREDAPRRRSTF